MRKAAIGIVAVAAMIGTPVLAADMPVKAPPPPPPPAYSWTGFYLGLNGGYGWGQTFGGPDSSDPATAAFLRLPTVSGPLSSLFYTSLQQRGALGGIQAGYNWQLTSNWVAGLEADIQWADIDQSNSQRILTSLLFVNTERKVDWFGTLRGRLGVLTTPNLLLYVTGGLAYGETKASGSLTNGGNIFIVSSGGFTTECNALPPATSTCYGGSGSQTSIGWTAGGGIEYMLLAHLTAKLEYLHVDLGGQTVTLVSPSPPSSPGVFMNYQFNHDAFDLIRGGLNYKF